jgi:hypothetical protein
MGHSKPNLTAEVAESAEKNQRRENQRPFFVVAGLLAAPLNYFSFSILRNPNITASGQEIIWRSNIYLTAGNCLASFLLCVFSLRPLRSLR